MGYSATLMAGWTGLLLWAYRRPLKRPFVAALTVFVIYGLVATEIVAVVRGDPARPLRCRLPLGRDQGAARQTSVRESASAGRPGVMAATRRTLCAALVATSSGTVTSTKSAHASPVARGGTNAT